MMPIVDGHVRVSLERLESRASGDGDRLDVTAGRSPRG